MGSRRRRYAALAVLLGCSGTPTGFGGGDSWTIPMVGPLEGGTLVVPAMIGGKGPYLVAIEPDASVSMIDEEVARDAKLRTGIGPHLLDESDTQQPRVYAEVLDWQIGTLTIHRTSNAAATVVKAHLLDRDGRRIYGALGRDIIADSLVFSFDRALGMATLTTQKAWHPPWNAAEIHFDPLVSKVQNVDVVPPPRRLVKATIGGGTFAVHVAFGAVASQLRFRSWVKAKLQFHTLDATMLDDTGQPRAIDQGGLADAVTVGGASARNVELVRFEDRRWDENDIDGTLGLGFFRFFSVVANWDRNAIYLKPLQDFPTTTVARIGRWPALAKCAHVGCAQVTLTDPLAGKPPAEMPAKHPGVVVSVAREAGAEGDLEVLVAVMPAAGKPTLQWLVANLHAGADRALTHLPADYVGATLAIVDASPFPRACEGGGACIDQLAAPIAVSNGSSTENK